MRVRMRVRMREKLKDERDIRAILNEIQLLRRAIRIELEYMAKALRMYSDKLEASIERLEKK